MTEILHFTGFIKGVKYKSHLTPKSVTRYLFEDFNVNTAKSTGIIKIGETEVSYSKWVSPKRTRSYPFSRIYNTYNAARTLTIIPIIKDEGADGDLDKLQYSTISWMNLMNVYIVLGYYESAQKSSKPGQAGRNKLTSQKFNSTFVASQIEEIINYRQSALHWNKSLFEERFIDIFRQGLDSYVLISQKTNIKIHSHCGMEKYLNSIIGDFEEFKNLSLKGSEAASKRESTTYHRLEHLADGIKATFCIRNYLGGLYYLTPDEILKSGSRYIIQESKNTTKDSLPSLNDIQDGLFKLILYSNIDSLQLNGEEVLFSVRLKLTGRNIKGGITMPCPPEALENFVIANREVFKLSQQQTLKKLLIEAQINENLEIDIRSNSSQGY